MPSAPTKTINTSVGLSGIVEDFLKTYFASHEGLLPTSGLYQLVITEVEKPLILATLNAVSGNQKKAAEILGINRNTLRKKINDLGLDLTLKFN